MTPQSAVTEVPIPTKNRFPFAIMVGADRAVWFTEENGNAIGRIDPARVR